MPLGRAYLQYSHLEWPPWEEGKGKSWKGELSGSLQAGTRKGQPPVPLLSSSPHLVSLPGREWGNASPPLLLHHCPTSQPLVVTPRLPCFMLILEWLIIGFIVAQVTACLPCLWRQSSQASLISINGINSYFLECLENAWEERKSPESLPPWKKGRNS